jgi:hypothetical protein
LVASKGNLLVEWKVGKMVVSMERQMVD